MLVSGSSEYDAVVITRGTLLIVVVVVVVVYTARNIQVVALVRVSKVNDITNLPQLLPN